MVESAPGWCGNAVDAYLSYLLEIFQHRDPRGFYRDVESRVRPTPDISESTESEYLVSNLEPFCHSYAFWQQLVALRESSQC